MPGVVLSLGSVNVDFVLRAPALPDGAGTIRSGDSFVTSGGKGANVAVAAARLGAPAVLLACVGDDPMAELALAGPADAGVELRVRRRPTPTGWAAIVVDGSGEKSMAVAAGANDAWVDDAAAVEAEVRGAPDGSVLVVDAEVPPDLVRVALRTAQERGLPTVLDPAPPERVSDELLALADHVTPDEREAEALSGRRIGSLDEAVDAAERVRARGARHAHVKLASGGCVTATPRGLVVAGAPDDIAVVDTTGAGDAFAGGLAWALHQGLDIAEAVRTAVATSSCAVGGLGSQEAYPNRAELDAMRRRIRLAA